MSVQAPEPADRDDAGPGADDFYVGYLELPPAHARFLRRLLPALAVLVAVVAALSAAAMRDPGPATWDAARERTWTGRLVVEPYPMLLVREEGRTRAILLVEMGKVAAHGRVEPLAGRAATVRGYLLEREGRRLAELAPDEEAVVAAPTAEDAAPPVPELEPLGSYAGAGEILDGKCWLGAMKPGDGKGHKACAILCIEGGLPPLLRSRGADGAERFHLLRVDGTHRLPPDVLDLVADPVAVEGSASRFADLLVLDAPAGDVRRRPRGAGR